MTTATVIYVEGSLAHLNRDKKFRTLCLLDNSNSSTKVRTMGQRLKDSLYSEETIRDWLIRDNQSDAILNTRHIIVGKVEVTATVSNKEGDVLFNCTAVGDLDIDGLTETSRVNSTEVITCGGTDFTDVLTPYKGKQCILTIALLED